MGTPRGATVQRGTPSRAGVVEWHGYVLRPRAVTVGRGKDAAAPDVGLEVVAIGVVGHGAGHVAVDRWGGGGPVQRRLQ